MAKYRKCTRKELIQISNESLEHTSKPSVSTSSSKSKVNQQGIEREASTSQSESNNHEEAHNFQNTSILKERTIENNFKRQRRNRKKEKFEHDFLLVAAFILAFSVVSFAIALLLKSHLL